ncbi:DUF4064 domain-containing protein [Halobacillus sp. A1]|uniref:DUF4064 domain-containing protein n=1 Tax=Halobacillus sp. A1 TaxID=2880262 RepID=UPI0020A6CF7A|nr:DUF4064 domain-containing protein [Halobacillus sp. A1]MCP3031608.1 DUF4064 domain-containing protein [Halobacillus sp. A1]
MKRTGEKILLIIALSLQLIVLVLGVLLAIFVGAQFPEQLPQYSEMWFVWVVFAVHLLGFILGVVALLMMRSRAKASGIIFICTGVSMAFLTLGATLIQSILFIVAGMMCLVRKPYESYKENEIVD